VSRAKRRANKKGIVLELVDQVRKSMEGIPSGAPRKLADTPEVVDRICEMLECLTDAVEELVTPPAAPERSDGQSEDRLPLRRRGGPPGGLGGGAESS
jgi:hypothetical protein